MIESYTKSGRFIRSSPYPNNSKLPKEKTPKKIEIKMIEEKITIVIPINLPITLNTTVIIFPMTLRKSCKPDVVFFPFL